MKLLSDIKLGLRHPKLILRKSNQFVYSRLGQWEYNRKGMDIFERDWDNLVLLDACRRDMVGKELFGEPVETVESRGSGTVEFLRGNFADRDLTDTVYITANPQLYKNRDYIDPTFHEVINLWTNDTWNEEHGTVLPTTVQKRTLEVAEAYPNKRLIIHFIQPHLPFIAGESNYNQSQVTLEGTNEMNLWMRISTGQIPKDDIQKIIKDYHANLSAVLPHAHELMKQLDGKTALTADHGNLLGERATPFPISEWGHPLQVYHPMLVEVPWIEIDDGTRKKVVAEKKDEETSSVTSSIVEERLANLGYK